MNRRAFMKATLTGTAAMTLAGQVRSEQPPFSMGKVDPRPGGAPDTNVAAVQAIADLNIRSFSEFERLPWFERDEAGALRLRRDIGLPRTIDIHAHVGTRHGNSPPINMMERSQYIPYYDFEQDQDVLFEHNHPTPKEVEVLTEQAMKVMYETAAISKSHTAANLIAEMDAMDVAHACLLPIEVPMESRHLDDTLAAAKLDQRFVPFGAVYPFNWNDAKADFLKEQQEKHGIVGIKYHPVFQFMPPDDPSALKMLEYCAENNLIVCSHIGYTGSELPFMKANSEPSRYIKALEALPKLRLVLLHTGVRRIDETLEVARKFPEQCWLGISGQPTPNIRYILQRYDTERVLFGSDWTFYPIAVMQARAFAATEGQPEIRARLMHDNAAKLLGLA